MSARVRKGYTWLGVFGHVARAVIFALVGYGLIKAAIDYDPDEAIGLDGALLAANPGEVRARAARASSPPGWPGSRSTRSPTRAIGRYKTLTVAVQDAASGLCLGLVPERPGYDCPGSAKGWRPPGCPTRDAPR